MELTLEVAFQSVFRIRILIKDSHLLQRVKPSLMCIRTPISLVDYYGVIFIEFLLDIQMSKSVQRKESENDLSHCQMKKTLT